MITLEGGQGSGKTVRKGENELTNMPLHGVRILDLGRTFAAPICTQMLADLGAEVIKVERLGRGDEIRYYGPPFLKDEGGKDTPFSSYFISANRNKRSIAIDFTKTDGQQIIQDLARKCHVCVENYKVGDLARYGLDYPGLSAVNPEMIYCSITGFGQTGPYAARPATDSVFQAMSGLMSVTGEPDGDPQKVGLVITDLLAGLNAAIAIQAALRHREMGQGTGQHIDISLLDVAVSTMSHRAVEYMMSGEIPMRMGTRTAGSAPAQIYRCKDGEINFQASAEPKFETLCTLLNRKDLLADARFRTRAERVVNIDALQTELEFSLRDWTMRDLSEALIDSGIICSPVYTMDQALEDPQIQERRLAREVNTKYGPAPIVANPIRMSGTPIETYDGPPDIGQHTDEILRTVLLYDDTRISRLRSSGAI
jgi:crotonobetainyl-CoA:carnitine CoA-transferase CaiB-like acyl-CoA transferase